MDSLLPVKDLATWCDNGFIITVIVGHNYCNNVQYGPIVTVITHINNVMICKL